MDLRRRGLKTCCCCLDIGASPPWAGGLWSPSLVRPGRADCGHRRLRCGDCTSVRPSDTTTRLHSRRRTPLGVSGAALPVLVLAVRLGWCLSNPTASDSAGMCRFPTNPSFLLLRCWPLAGREVRTCASHVRTCASHVPREAAPPPCAICPAGWPPTSCPLLLHETPSMFPYARVLMLVSE